MITRSTLTDALKGNGFEVVDALEYACGKHFYAAPKEGYKKLSQRVFDSLNDKLGTIFTNLAGETYRRGNSVEHAMDSIDDTARFTRAMYYPKGQSNIERPEAKVPYFDVWAGSCFYVQPSIQYVELFLERIKTVHKLSDKNIKGFVYKCLVTGENISIDLQDPIKESSVFTTLSELGVEEFRLPRAKRHELLDTIRRDIYKIGGAYNWTTDYRSEEIDIRGYNSFFKDKLKTA